MARNRAPDRTRASLAILATLVVLASRTAAAQVLVIVGAGLLGWTFFRATAPAATTTMTPTPVPRGKGLAIVSFSLFVVLLVGLPIARHVAPSHALAVFDSFYRTGSLVFGGGHV